jgi:CHAT domain-containing protein
MEIALLLGSVHITRRMEMKRRSSFCDKVSLLNSCISVLAGNTFLSRMLSIVPAKPVLSLQPKVTTISGTNSAKQKALKKSTTRTGEISRISEAQLIYDEAEKLYQKYTIESFKKSIEKYQAAERLFKAAGNHVGEAKALYRIGYIYNKLGEKQNALDAYNQSLSLSQVTGDRTLEAKTLIRIGKVYHSLGDEQKALEYYKKSLPLRQEVGKPAGEISALNYIGQGYFALGKNQEALKYYNQALHLSQTARNRIEEISTLNHIGQVYNALGETRTALSYYNQALHLSRAVGDRAAARQRITLIRLGLIYSSLGERQTAIEYYKQSISLNQVVSDRFMETINLNLTSKIYRDLGDKQKALDYLNQALSLCREVGYRAGEVTTLKNMALFFKAQGKRQEALSYIQNSTEALEDLRSNIDDQDLKISYFATVQVNYELQIDLSMQLHQQFPDKGYDRIALETSERKHGRNLLELLSESSFSPKATQENTPLFTQEHQLRQNLQQLEKQRLTLFNSKHTPTQLEGLKLRSDDLVQQIKDIAARLRKQDPSYADIKYPQPLTVTQIQQQVLDENTVLLEYFLGKEHSYLWMVTKTSLSSYELPKRADVKAAVNTFRKILKDPSQSNNLTEVAQASEPLSQMLLKPVASQLGSKRLLIVSDSALQSLPFSALSLPSQTREISKANPRQAAPFLLTEHEIVNVSSASTLAVLRTEEAKRKPAPKSIAIFADPVFSQDDIRLRNKNSLSVSQKEQSTDLNHLPTNLQTIRSSTLGRLLDTRQEAEQVIKLVSDKRSSYLALDFDANKENATHPDLNQYRIVHFATHGILNNLHPEQSGIARSNIDKQGAYQDGTLKLIDIFNLNLSADLVVLSACQTALGKDMRGEGLIGLTRGFMYAGTSRVLASLWNVNDESTAVLMTHFYKAILEQNLPPAAALRAAQLKMQLEPKWRLPYYWAAFTLQGEWK